MNELAYELIEFIREGSPAIWSVLMRQVYAVVISQAIMAVATTVLCVALARFGGYSVKRSKENSDWEMGAILGYAFSVMAGGIALALTNGVVMRLANPEFYAIQFVIQGLGQ